MGPIILKTNKRWTQWSPNPIFSYVSFCYYTEFGYNNFTIYLFVTKKNNLIICNVNTHLENLVDNSESQVTRFE